jgi:RimJ/RimL family protein N-acetyltransferase
MADVPSVTEACQDPEISRWTATVPWPYEEIHAGSWIATHDELRKTGTSAQFAIIDNLDHRLLGSFGFSPFDWQRLTATVGYWVAAPERNHGVATRASLLGSHWAFEELGLMELEIVTMIGNLGSEVVAQKAGFKIVSEIVDYRIGAVPDQTFHVKKWNRVSRPL